MAYNKRDVKDRIVQYPRRYQLVPAGENETYDLIPVTGTVTDEGTKLNKAYLQPIEDVLDGLGNVTHEIATTAEAQAGTSDVKYMTPLRTKEAIDARKKTLNRTVLANTVAAGGSRTVSIPIGTGKVGGMFIIGSTNASSSMFWKEVYFTDKLIDLMFFDSNNLSSPPSFRLSISDTEIIIVKSESQNTGYTYTYSNSVVGWALNGSLVKTLGLRNPKIVGTNLTFEIFNSQNVAISENCEIIWEVW